MKEPTHLDALGILKERIAILEKEQIALQSTNTTAKRTIKELEDGNSISCVSKHRITKVQR
jgi:hypothetical protein